MVRFVSKSPRLIRSCPRHDHDCWEIVIPIEGAGTLLVAGQRLHFAVGSVYVIPPHISHALRSESGFTDIFVHTSPLKLPEDRITLIDGIEEMPTLGVLLHRSYPDRPTASATLALIRQLIYERFLAAEDDLAHRVQRYLSDNLSTPGLSAKQVAEHFGYSEDHLRRCFQKEFDTTPTAHLSQLRVEEAKRLLINMPVYTIAQIAALCGFADPLYFSRFFKKYVGLSPQNYRTKK